MLRALNACWGFELKRLHSHPEPGVNTFDKTGKPVSPKRSHNHHHTTPTRPPHPGAHLQLPAAPLPPPLHPLPLPPSQKYRAKTVGKSSLFASARSASRVIHILASDASPLVVHSWICLMTQLFGALTAAVSVNCGRLRSLLPTLATDTSCVPKVRAGLCTGRLARKRATVWLHGEFANFSKCLSGL